MAFSIVENVGAPRESMFRVSRGSQLPYGQKSPNILFVYNIDLNINKFIEIRKDLLIKKLLIMDSIKGNENDIFAPWELIGFPARAQKQQHSYKNKGLHN